MPRVVLAMSGGVDSSASAVLLKRQGYDVVGLFMRTGATGRGVQPRGSQARADNKKGCCSAIDAGDARRVADRLDIPFYALDFESEFNRIIDYFADEYARGRTPNPCVVCNNWLKFGQLWAFGKKLGADFIATGHYARAINGELHKGIDAEKDQSYVLHGIKREVLPHLLFPVGEHTKPRIRQFAREAGLLGVAEKPDSVEICFVPSGRHTDVVRARRPEVVRAGTIIEKDGTVLGEHDGLDRFTVGQRKGLGVATGSKRFVLELLPESNTVVVGDEGDLYAPGLVAKDVNWLIDAPAAPLACTAKIRYRHAGVPATVTATAGGADVRFDTPQPAVTPGQAVAFYAGTRVLGGGWIERATK